MKFKQDKMLKQHKKLLIIKDMCVAAQYYTEDCELTELNLIYM